MCVGVDVLISAARGEKLADSAMFSPLDRERRLLHVAGRQHRCITTLQLREIGLSSDAVKRRVQSGRLIRLHRGVYAVAPASGSLEQRCAAAVLAAGSGAALSHMSAAVMCGWWKRSAIGVVEVTCDRKVNIPGIHVHSAHPWSSRDQIMVHGISAVRPERLAVQLSSQLTRYQLTNVIKEAAFWGQFDVGRFERLQTRLGARRGSVQARRAVASFQAGCAGTRSALEDRMVRLIERAGFPPPDEAGMPIGPHEVDLVWLDRELIIEVDGPGHRQPNSRRKDPARDADLRRAGFKVVRCTNHQIDGDPFGVVSLLEQCM